MVQIIADNPGQMAVIAAGAWVAGDLLGRLYRPRGLIGVAAFTLVANTAAGWAIGQLLTRGVIRLNIRCGLCAKLYPAGASVVHFMTDCDAAADADPAA